MKTFVTIYIPAISAKYDVLIPDSLRLRSVTNLIANMVENLSDHLYIASGEECLCSVEKNILLRNGATLKQYGIQNGDHLILM